MKTLLKTLLGCLFLSFCLSSLSHAQRPEIQVRWSEPVLFGLNIEKYRTYPGIGQPGIAPVQLLKDEGYFLTYRPLKGFDTRAQNYIMTLEEDLSRLSTQFLAGDGWNPFHLFQAEGRYYALGIKVASLGEEEEKLTADIQMSVAPLDLLKMKPEKWREPAYKRTISEHTGGIWHKVSPNGAYILIVTAEENQEPGEDWSPYTYHYDLISGKGEKLASSTYRLKKTFAGNPIPELQVSNEGECVLLFERFTPFAKGKRENASGPVLVSFDSDHPEPREKNIAIGVHFLYGQKMVSIEKGQVRLIGAVGKTKFQEFAGVYSALIDLQTLEVSDYRIAQAPEGFLSESYLGSYNGEAVLRNWYEAADGTLSLLFQHVYENDPSDKGSRYMHGPLLMLKVSPENQIIWHHFLPYKASFNRLVWPGETGSPLGAASEFLFNPAIIREKSYAVSQTSLINEKGFFLLGAFHPSTGEKGPEKKPKSSFFLVTNTYFLHFDQAGEMHKELIVSGMKEGRSTYMAPAYFGPQEKNAMLFVLQNKEGFKIGEVSW